MAAGRPRHIPQRSCVACRTPRAQRELIRLVRSAAGGIDVDERGRAPGRGAYLCQDGACWRRALAGGALQRALRAELTAQRREALEQYAAGLPEAAAAGGGER